MRREPSHPVDAAVARWLATLPAPRQVLLAYSGGLDSSVLLHALTRARNHASDHTVSVSAAHIHHGLSANADAWAAHCESTCNALGIAFTAVRVQLEQQEKIGIEAAARAARYAALTRLAHDQSASIALAHHAQDQAETVLLQLLRGAGPAGLAAMPEHAPPFARPLLAMSKAQMEEYARLHAISHIVDESNADPRFARNRLRHHVWPTIVEHFPSAERTLSRAALWQHESDEIATALAEIDLAHCAEKDALSLARWRALSAARRSNLLRHWLSRRSLPPPSAERLREWEAQLRSDNATQNILLTHASMPGAIRRYRDRIEYVTDNVFASHEPTATNHASPFAPIAWRGETELKFFDQRIICEHVAANAENSRNCLRLISAGENWQFRVRQEKDSITLSPEAGSRLLKNLFQDADIPPWQRGRWPILSCNGVVAAVPEIAVAHAFRATPGERGYLLSVQHDAG